MCRRLPTHLVVLVLLFAFPAAAGAAPDRSTDGAKPARSVETLPTPGDQAVEIALRHLGTPYSWAGSSPSGFDCSGFVMYVYGKLGIGLPHSSSMLWGEGWAVPRQSSSPATSSSSTASPTWASTWAAAGSCTLRIRATSSRSRASRTTGTAPHTTEPGASPSSPEGRQTGRASGRDPARSEAPSPARP